MKTKKSVKFLSIFVCAAVLLCCLPFSFSITGNAQNGAYGLDYTTVSTSAKNHISWYRDTLNMYDGTGLASNGSAIIAEDAWLNQMSVETTVEKCAPFAVYDVAPSSSFVAAFTSDTDLSSVSVMVSDNFIDWYVTNPIADDTAKTLTLNDVGAYTDYVKLVWPMASNSATPCGLIGVDRVKAYTADNRKYIDYSQLGVTASTALGSGKTDTAVLVSRGVWTSSGLSVHASGVVSPVYSTLLNKTEYDSHIVYKVQPGTLFRLNANSMRQLDDIAKTLGYSDVHDYNLRVYGSLDGVNYTEIENAVTFTLRYGNNQDSTKTVTRSADVAFIVPDDVVYVKIQSPVDKDLQKAGVYAYVGNDLIEINAAEFSQIKYDYRQAHKNASDYYMPASALTAENKADYGIYDYSSNITSTIDSGFDVKGSASYTPQYITYNVQHGTPFFADVRIHWLSGLNGIVNTYGKTYRVMLQGSNDNAAWTDLETITFDSTTWATVTENSTKELYNLCITADENKYSYIRFYLPDSAYVTADGSVKYYGNNMACLSGVAFTPQSVAQVSEPIIDKTYNENRGSLYYSSTYTYAQQLEYIGAVSSDSYGLTYAATGIQTSWDYVAYNNAFESPKANPYLIYEVSEGQRIILDMYQSDTYVNGDPYWTVKVFTNSTNSWGDDAGYTEHTLTSNGSNDYICDFYVPEGHTYMKVLWPNVGNIFGSASLGGAAGNDLYRLEGYTVYAPVTAEQTPEMPRDYSDALSGGGYMINTSNLGGTSVADGAASFTLAMNYKKAYLPIAIPNTPAYYKMSDSGVYKITFDYVSNSNITVRAVGVNTALPQSDDTFSELTTLYPTQNYTAGDNKAVIYYQPQGDDKNSLVLEITSARTDAELTISNIEITAFENNSVVSATYASALTDEVAQQKGNQAIRFYASYASDILGDLKLAGKDFEVVERGILIRGYNESNTKQMTVNSTSAEALKLSRKSDMRHYYWGKTESDKVTFSFYLYGFDLENGHEAQLESRAYIIVQNGDTQLVFYSDHTVTSLAQLLGSSGDSSSGSGESIDLGNPPSAAPEISKDYSFDENGISETVLNNYLDHAINYSIGHGTYGFEEEGFNEAIRFITNVGAKYVARAGGEWCPLYTNEQFYPQVQKSIALAHAVDPEIVFEAAVFECIVGEFGDTPIPAYVFEAFGLEVENRRFHVDDMLFEDGYGIDIHGGNMHAPDITNLETQMFYYYRATKYIDLGYEAIHFGQTLMTGRDDAESGYECWAKVISLVREYAKTNARRGYVLINSHDNGKLKNAETGEYYVDFIMTPVRAHAASGETTNTDPSVNPQECIIEPGYWGNSPYQAGFKGTSPSGWSTENYPYLAEFDNYNFSVSDIGNPDIYVWGMDEHSWYCNQTSAYKKTFMQYLLNTIDSYNENGHVSFVGHRGSFYSIEKAKSVYYYANNTDTCTMGYTDEDWIKELISSR